VTTSKPPLSLSRAPLSPSTRVAGRPTQFTLPPELEAHEPPEARGLARDGVRLLVGTGDGVSHHAFTDLPDLLRPGDVLVVNTSATLPAAVPVLGTSLTVHFSTEREDGTWLVELRRLAGKASSPFAGGEPGRRYPLPAGAVTLLSEYSRGRLWSAAVDTGGLASVQAFLHRYGQPIRYGYVPRAWPLEYYQTVFGIHPGSAEMPSAGRPFTDRLVTRLVAAGVLVVPVLLHTGVASPEAHERPYPERFAVPDVTVRVVAQAKAEGRRVIAVGTTAVRALETAWEGPRRGWTDLVIMPERGVRVVDGLLTGFHEPRASHLDMLAAIAGDPLLARCYDEALHTGYLWHEFGDVNLLLP
jgi:S-adenosylmethionine:tRNA ribosyltransferase-isomerase